MLLRRHDAKIRCFQSVCRQYFYLELERCLYGRHRLHLLPGLYLKKTIQTLSGVLWVGGHAVHCINPKCRHHKTHYLSNQLAALSLPEVAYGSEVEDMRVETVTVQIIPGHGTISDMKRLKEYHRMLVETTDWICKQRQANKCFEDIYQTMPKEWQAWGQEFISTGAWIELVLYSYGMGAESV